MSAATYCGLPADGSSLAEDGAGHEACARGAVPVILVARMFRPGRMFRCRVFWGVSCLSGQA